MDGARRTSSLRAKTLLIIVATALLLVAVPSLAMRAVFVRNFERLEEDAAEHDLQRVRNALEDDLAGLHATTRDYATWDDTYAFLGGDPAHASFPAVNFDDATLANSRLNLVVLADRQARVVFSKGFDHVARAAAAAGGEALFHASGG